MSSRGRERERDEVSLLQTEAAMVGRENGMLRGRIRELEGVVEGLKGEGASLR